MVTINRVTKVNMVQFNRFLWLKIIFFISFRKDFNKISYIYFFFVIFQVTGKLSVFLKSSTDHHYHNLIYWLEQQPLIALIQYLVFSWAKGFLSDFPKGCCQRYNSWVCQRSFLNRKDAPETTTSFSTNGLIWCFKIFIQGLCSAFILHESLKF